MRNRFESKNQVLEFVCIKFLLPIKHPSEYAKQISSLELRESHG